MKKTLVALFVALCMVLTMAPAMAFAADEPQIDSVVYYADKDAADEAGVDVGDIVVTLKSPIGNIDTKIGFEIEVNSDRYYYKATNGEAADINKKSFSFKMTATEKNWNDGPGDDLAAGTYTINMFKYTDWDAEGKGDVIDTATFTVPGESIDLANGFFDVANPDADTVKGTPFEGRSSKVTDQTFYFQVEEAIANGNDRNGYLFEITADGKTYSAVGNVLSYKDVHATLYGSFLSDGVDFIDKVKTTDKNNDYELAPGTYTVSVLKFAGNGYNNGIASDIFGYPVDAKEVATFEITVASADYSDWNGLVAYINNLDEMDYTKDGWEKFCANVEPYISSEGASYVKPDQPKTYQDTIEDAEGHLEWWIEWLPLQKTADYSYLNAMIAVAEGLDKSDYTADSWEAVEAALEKAKEVPLRLPASDQTNVVDDAAVTLVLAMSRLVGVEKANYAAVDAAIAKAETLTEADYTADSWAAVEAAIDAVVRDLPVSDQAKVDAMAKAINDAIDALVVEKANYAAVDAAIAKAETLTEADYTADSWAAVEAAIDAVVRDLPVSDQAKVDAMAKAINDAIDALVAAEEDPTEIVFDDVEQGRWSAQYIYDLVEKGICDGIGDNKFNPEGNIERCAFAKILAEASGDDLTRYEGTSNFADCRGSWAETYINWAYANGIVTGRTDTTFDPYGEISRQEMAAMIYRYAEYKGIELPETNELITFDDEEQIADYAAEAVDAMQKAGIINGMDNNEFQPQGTATREQAAKMISVLLSL